MTSPQPNEPPAQPPAAPAPPELSQPYYPTYPQSYPQGYPQPWPVPMPYPTMNGLAVAGFVCSFFSLIGGILGVVFGGIALSQIAARGQRGKGLAIAGLAIGGCWVLFTIVGVLSSLATP